MMPGHRALRVKMIDNALLDLILNTDAVDMRIVHHRFHLDGSRCHFNRFGSFQPADELLFRPFGEVEAIEHAVVVAR